jgi:site-specific DNA recombinase
MAEATFSHDEWQQLQAVVAQRTSSGKARQMTQNPLAGIGFCVCGYALSLHRRASSSGTVHTYVRCGSSKKQCRGAERLDTVDEFLGDTFLEYYGDREMTRQVFVPGADHSAELDQVERSLERLRWESDNGLIDDEELYKSRLAGLASRRAELKANTVVPARWEAVGTGKTYRDLWSDPDTDRRQVLRDSRIRLVLHCLPKDSKASTKVLRMEFQDLWREE